MTISRRSFVAGATAGAWAPSPILADVIGGSNVTALAPFASDYLRARNAPGMIVGVADRSGWSETAVFGFADIDARRAIRPDERFHIGSISKSFTALMILQLVDEGKVRLDADVTAYLPGLSLATPFGPVTVHHLLCHTAGLQSEPPAPGWPDQRVEQTFAPGSRFHYSNMGYAWLGRIIVARGGEDWAQALHRRVLDPLGMAETSALIGAGMRRWEAPSYVRRDDDRPFIAGDALARAAPTSFTAASGCIASTARDMNRYIAMIARGGAGPNRRLLPPELFASMTRRHIAATELGPKGGYGYGWMTDEIDERPVIRHTGGMISFMSSIHVDLDVGYGAFASINAQQNYRPVPVTRQAIRLHRARMAGSPAPKAPSVDADADLDVKDYVGDYLNESGSVARVVATGRRLTLMRDGGSYPLESLADDKFACRDPRFRLFTFLFRREKPLAEAEEGKRNRVWALDWGKAHFVRPGAPAVSYAEPDQAALPAAMLGRYEGLYVADGGWLTSMRIVVRDQRLWADTFDGCIPLANLGGGRFRFADERVNPETAMFSTSDTAPRTLSIAGAAMVRVGDAFDVLG